MKRIVVVALFVVGACGKAQPADVAAEPPPKDGEIVIDSASPKLAAIGIDTVRVTHEHTVAMLPAQLALDENHTVRVFSPVTGRVRTLLANPGAAVAAGAPLARIASSDMSQAMSDQAKADASLVQTTAALTRAEDLYAHKVIALKDLEQARSDAAQARAESERAKQRAALLGGGADGIQGDFILRSPIAGIVIDRSVNEGAEVRPDATVQLFTVSSLDTLWLIAAAPQRDLEQLRTGAHLAFTTDAVPGRTFDARVVYVGDQLDPVTRTTVVRAAICQQRPAAPRDGRGVRAADGGGCHVACGGADARARHTRRRSGGVRREITRPFRTAVRDRGGRRRHGRDDSRGDQARRACRDARQHPARRRSRAVALAAVQKASAPPSAFRLRTAVR